MQRQDNILVLLSLLDPTSPYADYYSRLYSVQILSAICDSRPQRLQECILSAPLGVSRLVATLDDARDAIRNAGLLLLVDLTSGANEDLRKIVAFEDVFAKVFALIRMEGGLAEAGITAQDCLSLLANLIRGSGSNQTMFRESGCVAQLAQLLQQAFPPSDQEAAFVLQSREKSTFGLLQLLRLFLFPGEPSTPQNQTALFRAGIAQILIDLGFSSALPIPIRMTALTCTSDLIANNAPLQENFAALTVVTPADADAASTTPSPQQANGTGRGPHSNKASARTSAEKPRTYVIEALLDLALDKSQEDMALRHAACALIQAYLVGHDRIRAHFLSRAISGHAQQERNANVLTTLSQPSQPIDAMALIFASSIVQELIFDDTEAKSALAAVREGNESEGEEILSFIQSLGAELEGALQPDGDERAVAAYASLLTVCLWEFAQGVDDLLAEGSSLVQALAGAPKATSPDPLVSGMSVTLLGTIYEFSTKDSPIPRRTLAPLLTQKLGRRKYMDTLAELRRQPAVRDFDMLEGGDVDSLLAKPFVDLFTLEYARLRKAIDKDPGVEVLPTSAAEAGVDRDVLDDLRQQLQTAKDALAQAQDQGMAAGQTHEQERLAAAKDLQTSNAEVERLRRINQAMQQGHETELDNIAAQHEEDKQRVVTEHERALSAAQQETQKLVQAAVREKEAAYTELGNTLRTEQTGHANTRQQFEALTAKHNQLMTRERDVSAEHAELSQRHGKLEQEHQQLQSSSTQTTNELERMRNESTTNATTISTLQSQLKDLQDELKGKETELAAERAGFADLERELEAAKSAAKTSSDAGKLGEVEKELEDAKESEKAAKEELESMLLVMGDIEAKRDAYREIVRELGGDVTEDEEDEEEDDDGEEDEID